MPNGRNGKPLDKPSHKPRRKTRQEKKDEKRHELSGEERTALTVLFMWAFFAGFDARGAEPPATDLRALAGHVRALIKLNSILAEDRSTALAAMNENRALLATNAALPREVARLKGEHAAGIPVPWESFPDSGAEPVTETPPRHTDEGATRAREGANTNEG